MKKYIRTVYRNKYLKLSGGFWVCVKHQWWSMLQQLIRDMNQLNFARTWSTWSPGSGLRGSRLWTLVEDVSPRPTFIGTVTVIIRENSLMWRKRHTEFPSKLKIRKNRIRLEMFYLSDCAAVQSWYIHSFFSFFWKMKPAQCWHGTHSIVCDSYGNSSKN